MRECVAKGHFIARTRSRFVFLELRPLDQKTLSMLGMMKWRLSKYKIKMNVVPAGLANFK